MDKEERAKYECEKDKEHFENMNCVEKNVFLEKYISDPNIYTDQTMKDWLQDNFNDNCNLNK